jgi:predicted permease
MTWWHRLTHRRKMEEQLDRELSFHLDQLTRDLMARGHSAAEARRLARIEIGGPDQVKEECRDARGTRWVEDFVQDVRYALRTLRQRPGFAAVALLSLALGTGATTVIFSLIDGVMLQPFPYRDPSHLVRLWEQTDWTTQFGNLWAFTYPNYLDCRQSAHSLDMAAWSVNRGTLSERGAAEFLDGVETSHDLFSLLGVQVELGRVFLPEEDKPGAAPVALISDRVWQDHFGGNRDALGAKLIFDGHPYTVIGVLPAAFRLEDDRYDVFTPVGQDTSPAMQNRAAHAFRVWARRRPGASLAQVQTELSLVGQRLAKQYPDSNKGRTFISQALKPDVGDTSQTLYLLLAAVVLVLLIACANIASLLLARAVSRGRELAMRAALGAGRGRLARQCLTESGVLAVIGGALGVVLAAVGIRPFTLYWPGGLPRVQEVQLNWRVLLFALTVSILSGLLFGLAPALRAPARHLEQTLRSGGRTLAGSSHRLHGAFVAAEIAIAVVLLVSAGLLGRTMMRLSALDPGLNIHNVLTARTALSPATLADPDRTRAGWDYLLDRARRVPGVEAVAMVDTVPMRSGSNPIDYSTIRTNFERGHEYPTVLANSVTPDYLTVTGIPLRRGRFFTDNDRKGTQSVAVIDDVMAQQAFPGQDPIGKPLWIALGTDPAIVVGVVGHVRQWGLASDDQSRWRAQLYYPFAQLPDRLVHRWSELMSIAVRTGVDPLMLVQPLRNTIRGAAGDQVLYEVHTLEELADSSLARQRFLLLLFGIFAALALLLACIGIYGVLAYLTSRRVPEIGVRMALGATAPDVLWMVLRQSVKLIFVGVMVGGIASWFATRALVRLVDGVRPADAVTVAAMILLLTLAALFASFFPARRASRLSPIRALRQE